MSESALPRASTVADTLEALARRCENERPDRGLDLDIGTAMGWRLERSGDSHFADWFSPEGETGPDYAPPYYTTSLDAAVTLVPPDSWKESNGPRRYLNIPSPSPNYWHCEVTTWDPTRMSHGWGATESLAICAAALRSRAALAREADTRGKANPGDAL